MWFPMKERGLATSVYITGQYIGTPLFAGLLLWLAQTEGWRSVFYTTGSAGILLGLAWYFIYQDQTKSVCECIELLISRPAALGGNKERIPFD